jgi:hypothetical protein
LSALFDADTLATVEIADDELVSAVAKVSDEVIAFARSALAPWIAKAVELAKSGRGDKFVPVGIAIAAKSHAPILDKDGNPSLDKDGKPRFEDVSADAFASQIQSALRQSMTEEETNPIPKIYKRDNEGKGHVKGAQAVDSHNRPVFLSPMWQVRVGGVKPTDKGYDKDKATEQRRLLIRLTLNTLVNEENALGTHAETAARQDERAATVAAAKRSNTGKATTARKAS